jgi:hypothetical protein
MKRDPDAIGTILDLLIAALVVVFFVILIIGPRL